MKTIPATTARRHWSHLLGRVQYRRESFGVVRNGTVVAAIIPFDDLELLRQLEDEIDLAEARAAIVAQGKRKRADWTEIKAYLGMD